MFYRNYVAYEDKVVDGTLYLDRPGIPELKEVRVQVLSDAVIVTPLKTTRLNTRMSDGDYEEFMKLIDTGQCKLDLAPQTVALLAGYLRARLVLLTPDGRYYIASDALTVSGRTKFRVESLNLLLYMLGAKGCLSKLFVEKAKLVAVVNHEKSVDVMIKK